MTVARNRLATSRTWGRIISALFDPSKGTKSNQKYKNNISDHNRSPSGSMNYRLASEVMFRKIDPVITIYQCG